MIESDESTHYRKVMKKGLIERIPKEESLPYSVHMAWKGYKACEKGMIERIYCKKGSRGMKKKRETGSWHCV